MAEPISETEARQHLRLAATEPAPLLDGYIAAAREWVEDYTGQTLVRRQVTEACSASMGRVTVRAWPIATDLPMLVRYRDRSGVTHEITDVEVRAAVRPAKIAPSPLVAWPGVLAGQAEVTLTAGYASAEAIPHKFKQAMLLLITAYHEDREGGDLLERAEASARRLCRKEKSWRL